MSDVALKGITQTPTEALCDGRWSCSKLLREEAGWRSGSRGPISLHT